MLGSYTAQAELGDYNELDHGTTFDYLKELQFAPVQDEELLKRIHEQHKRHKYEAVCCFFRIINFILSLSLKEVNHLMRLIYISLKMLKS